MQFVAGGRGAYRRTDCRCLLAGDTDYDLTLGEFAWSGADGLLNPRTGAVDKGLRTDALDGLNRQIQRDTARRNGFAGDREILRPDADAGLGGTAAVTGELQVGFPRRRA